MPRTSTHTRAYVSPPKKKPTPHQPLWKGPVDDGLTFSLLNKWLECRERFRLKVIEGLSEEEGFNHSIEFGNMWHEAEEAFAQGKDWELAMRLRHAKWRANYQGYDAEVNKWFQVCKVTFPLYIAYWKNHPVETQREHLLTEQTFRVLYTLPSGRKLTLRGKWDGVLSVKQRKRLLLQENKSKGTIDEEGMTKTLHENLQTMMYCIAFDLAYVPDEGVINAGGKQLKVPLGSDGKPPKLDGILYNVVRRPLSDKYPIRQRKTETESQFYQRLAEDIRTSSFRNDKPLQKSEYFHRWQIDLKPKDLTQFRHRVLDPILEQFMDWWEWIKVDPFDPWRARTYGELGWHEFPDDDIIRNVFHYQSPWGVYNSLAGGFRGEFFHYLTSGSRVGLHKVSTLYPELTPLDDPAT